jgi:hypothetical protein
VNWVSPDRIGKHYVPVHGIPKGATIWFTDVRMDTSMFVCTADESHEVARSFWQVIGCRAKYTLKAAEAFDLSAVDH